MRNARVSCEPRVWQARGATCSCQKLTWASPGEGHMSLGFRFRAREKLGLTLRSVCSVRGARNNGCQRSAELCGGGWGWARSRLLTSFWRSMRPGPFLWLGALPLAGGRDRLGKPGRPNGKKIGWRVRAQGLAPAAWDSTAMARERTVRRMRVSRHVAVRLPRMECRVRLKQEGRDGFLSGRLHASAAVSFHCAVRRAWVESWWKV